MLQGHAMLYVSEGTPPPRQKQRRNQVTVTKYDTLTAAAGSCLVPERVTCHAAGEGEGKRRGFGRAVAVQASV